MFGARSALATTNAQALTLALYPNPATGTTTLALAAANQARSVAVLDAVGRVVRQQQLPAQAATATLNLAGLPSGVYAVCAVALPLLVW